MSTTNHEGGGVQPSAETIIDYCVDVLEQWARGYEELVAGNGQVRIDTIELAEPGRFQLVVSTTGALTRELARYDLRITDQVPTQRNGPAERDATDLRRELDQALDEIGVLQDRVRQLQRRQARHLEGLEHQGLVIQRLWEYCDGKDIVRTDEVRRLLEELSR